MNLDKYSADVCSPFISKRLPLFKICRKLIWNCLVFYSDIVINYEKPSKTYLSFVYWVLMLPLVKTIILCDTLSLSPFMLETIKVLLLLTNFKLLLQNKTQIQLLS